MNKQTKRVKDQVVENYINQMKDKEEEKFPDFIIFEFIDPRILGDNYSKVSKIVSFIGGKKEALEHQKLMKNSLKFGGTNCTSFSYPRELKDSESTLRLGEEIIIHPEKHEPNDDDFQDENEEGDFFD